MNVEKMTKKLNKMNAAEQLEYLKTEVVGREARHPGRTLMALKSIHDNKMYSDKLGQYLRDVIFPEALSPEVRDIAFEIIVEINDPESSIFYWDAVLQNTLYRKEAIKALRKLGINGFEFWKEYSVRQDIKPVIDQIIDYDAISIHALLDYYLTLPLEDAIGMNHILIEHQALVLQNIASRIAEGEIVQYDAIQNIVELYDENSLPEYDQLFEIENSGVSDIIKKIYQHYIQKGYIHLDELYRSVADPDERIRIIRLHRQLGNIPYRNNIESYLEKAQTDDEQVALIVALVSWYETIPEVFYSLLGSRDFFYHFKLYIPNYIGRYHDSINRAFMRTDIAGKINLLEFLFDSKEYETLNRLLENLEVKQEVNQEIKSLWSYCILRSVKSDVSLERNHNIVIGMLQCDENQVIHTAALYIERHYADFEQDVINVLSSNGIRAEKWLSLVGLFHYAENDYALMFLVKQCKKHWENAPEISNAIAEVLISNSKFQLFSLCRKNNYRFPKWMPPLIASRLHTHRDDMQKYCEYFMEHFFEYGAADRSRVLRYLKTNGDPELFRYLIRKFDRLLADEKLVVNSAIGAYVQDEMSENHIRKLLLTGNQDDVEFIERLISVHQISSPKVMDSLRKRYFRDYRWDRYSGLDFSDSEPVNTLIDSIYFYYIGSREYNARFSDSVTISQCYPNQFLKMTGDSIAIYSEMVDNPLVSCNKNKIRKSLERSIQLYNTQLVENSMFLFGVADSSHFQRLFNVGLIRVTRESKLHIGRETITAEDGNKFLLLVVEVCNRGSTTLPFDEMFFALVTDQTTYEPSAFGRIYLDSIDRELYRQVGPNETIYTTLIYDVDYDAHDFILEYRSPEGVMVDTPLKFAE